MPRVDANGKWLDTDKRALVPSDESVVVTATNKYKTAYTVKFTKAGEFTLTASAYQSVLYPQTVISEGITVKAGYTALAVRQSHLKKAVVTFDTNVAGLNVDNFTAYYMLDGVKCPTLTTKATPISENEVEVTFFSNFVGGREYFVEYDGETVDSFVAIKVNDDSVESIEIPAQNIVAKDETQHVAWKLIGPDAIVLAENFDELDEAGLTGVFDFTCPDEDRVEMYLTSSDGGIYFAEAGKVVTIKVTYSWYSDLTDKKVEGSGVVTSVNKPDWTLSNATLAITRRGADNIVWGNINKVAHFAQGDDVVLQGRFEWTKPNGYMRDGLDAKHAYLDNKKYEVFSSDEKIVMTQGYEQVKVDGEWVDTNKIRLVANNTGSCTLLVYLVTDDGEGNAVRGDLVATIPVTVEPARKAETLKVTPNKTHINYAWRELEDQTTSDKITFSGVLYDQYGEALDDVVVAGKTVTYGNVMQKDGQVVDKTAKTPASGVATFAEKNVALANTFAWNDNCSAQVTTIKSTDIVKFNKAGKLTFNFSAKYDNVEKYASVIINVVNETGANKYNLFLTGSELNTTVDGNNKDIKTISVGLSGQTKHGYDYEGTGVEFYPVYDNRFVSKISGDAFADKYIYTVQRDGQYVGNIDSLTNRNNGGAISGDALMFDDLANTFVNFSNNGDQLLKLKTGKYVVTSYVGVAGTENNHDVVTFRLVGSQSFTVKDETPAPIVQQVKDNIAKGGSVNEAFKVYWPDTNNEIKYLTEYSYDYTISNVNATSNNRDDSVWVKTVTVPVTVKVGGVEYSWTFGSVPVKALLWKTNKELN